MKSGHKINVLAIVLGFIPSTYIYIIKPLVRLHRDGHVNFKVVLESHVNRRAIEKADIILFCRNTLMRYSHNLNLILSKGKPFIYDIDDNLFDIPVDSGLAEVHRSEENIAMLTRYLKTAQLIRVYSDPLKEKLTNLNTNIEKVVGPVDFNLIAPPSKKGETVKIIYSTSRIYDDLDEIFLPALTAVMKRYGQKIEVHFWGVKPNLKSDFNNVIVHPLTSNYNKFLRRFSRSGFDIGLVPLKDDIFHQSKTNVKFREYGACGIAGIYTNIEVYSSCVQDGETGLLVENNTESWYRAMVRLIEDTPLRQKIQAQAQKYARQHYSQIAFEEVWMHQIHNILAGAQFKAISVLSSDSIAHKPVGESTTTSNNTDPGKKHIIKILSRKSISLLKHTKRYGIQKTCWIVQRKIYDIWSIFILRLQTSTFVGTFSRKKQ